MTRRGKAPKWMEDVALILIAIQAVVAFVGVIVFGYVVWGLLKL